MKPSSFARACAVALALSLGAAWPAAHGSSSQDEAAKLQRYYDELDAKAQERSGRRPWHPSFDLLSAVNHASPGAQVEATVCGPQLCRMVVRHSGSQASADFARRLMDTGASEGGVVFRRHADDALKTTAYVLRPPAPERFP